MTQVNIVIHSAATVRFDAHLRIALNINILALQDLLKLSLEMKNFKVSSETVKNLCFSSNSLVGIFIFCINYSRLFTFRLRTRTAPVEKLLMRCFTNHPLTEIH